MRTALLFTLATAILGAPALSFSQTTFHGDNARSGVFPGAAPKSIEAPAWSFTTGGAVLSSAAVADGVAYFGSDDRNLYAVKLSDGSLLWKFATGGIVRSSPAVAEGIVYFGSYDGIVYALSANSGEPVWKFSTAGERHFEAKGLHGFTPAAQTIPDFWDMYASSPAVANGLVYIGSGDGNLYALCARTGKEVWKFATGDVVHSSPALSGDTVYFGSFDAKLYALDAKSGAFKWSFQTGLDPQKHNKVGIQASPTLDGGNVYFGCRDFNLYALDAATGEKKWAHSITWSNATAAVSRGRVYYGTSIPALFVGLDAVSGEETAKIPMPLMVFSSPAIVGDRAYVGSFDGCLYEIDLGTGKVSSVYRTAASAAHYSKILKSDGSVDFGRVFRSDSFDEMYRAAGIFFEMGAILSSPTVSDGALLVGSCDGNLYCFR
ncbi:MAG TPA: PQQ-binding-like beta-propeller repeat protein [Opitutales bacterium]|nr:PQQ-binding-like beta-propeller repeat protein [Opitutales bacterium]